MVKSNLWVSIAVLLAACGGGGGGSSNPAQSQTTVPQTSPTTPVSGTIGLPNISGIDYLSCYPDPATTTTPTSCTGGIMGTDGAYTKELGGKIAFIADGALLWESSAVSDMPKNWISLSSAPDLSEASFVNKFILGYSIDDSGKTLGSSIVLDAKSYAAVNTWLPQYGVVNYNQTTDAFVNDPEVVAIVATFSSSPTSGPRPPYSAAQVKAALRATYLTGAYAGTWTMYFNNSPTSAATFVVDNAGNVTEAGPIGDTSESSATGGTDITNLASPLVTFTSPNGAILQGSLSLQGTASGTYGSSVGGVARSGTWTAKKQ